jgi:hypothetical protein
MKRRVVLTFFAALTLVFLAQAAATASTVTFNLLAPNTAMATSGPFNGDTISLLGGGTFNPATARVLASGSFAITNPSGALVAKGTWQATSFVSFTAFGGPSPAFQGGVLEIKVTQFFAGGTPVSNVLLTVFCEINAPPPFAGIEGVTIGDFTQIKRGGTLFHLN